MIMLRLYMRFRFLNNRNIIIGSENIPLRNQQFHTFPADWCTNLDLHFVRLDPNLKIISPMLTCR